MLRPPKLTSELLAKKARTIFGDGCALSVLDRLSKCRVHANPEELLRIHLAILKLCDEDGIDKLTQYLTAANTDYRDVLFWAEYPTSARLSITERAQPESAKAARSKDRAQYLAWLLK